MGFKLRFRGLFFILLTIFLAFETLKNLQNGQKYKERPGSTCVCIFRLVPNQKSDYPLVNSSDMSIFLKRTLKSLTPYHD